MSEFSESYHFPNSDLDTLYERLKAGGMRGRLYGPSMNRWVSFVPYEGACPGHQFLAGPAAKFGGSLSMLAGKPVLEYIYAEGHMWFACLWENGEVAAHYSCDWEDGEPKIESRNAERLRQLPIQDRMAVADGLAPKLDTESLGEEEPRAYLFAEGLGLPVYKWTSAQYLAADARAGEQRNDGGIEI